MEKLIQSKITTLYKSMLSNSKKRGSSIPEQSIEEFREWLPKQKRFTNIILNWVDSNFNTYLAPSVDRIDEKKGYNLDNIRLITWVENMNLSHIDRASKILQYDMYGKFIEEYPNKYSASSITGDSPVTITGNCNNITKLTANGFQYKYKISNKIIGTYNGLTHTLSKEVLQLNMSGIVVNEFKSYGEALSHIGRSKDTQKIAKVINQLHTLSNHYWCSPDNYDNFKEVLESIKVLQYDVSGKFIKEFNDKHVVKKELGFSISKALKLNKALAGNFQWKYKNSSKKIEPYTKSKRPTKEVHQFSMSEEYITTFPSIKEAALSINGKQHGLSGNLFGEKNSYYGFKWSRNKKYTRKG